MVWMEYLGCCGWRKLDVVDGGNWMAWMEYIGWRGWSTAAVNSLLTPIQSMAVLSAT